MSFESLQAYLSRPLDENTPPPVRWRGPNKTPKRAGTSPGLMGSPLFGLLTSPKGTAVVDDRELTPVEKKILMRRASPVGLPSSPASPQPQRRLHFNGDAAAQARSASAPPMRQPLARLDGNLSPAAGRLASPRSAAKTPASRKKKKKALTPSDGSSPAALLSPFHMQRPVDSPGPQYLPGTPSDTFFLSSSEEEDGEEEEESFMSPIGSRLLSSPCTSEVPASEGLAGEQEEEERASAAAPDRTPAPKAPPSSPPPSDSTVRLIEQGRAIRTPQPVEAAKIQAWLDERAAGMARYCVTETVRALRVECSTPSLSEEGGEGGLQVLDVNSGSDPRSGQHPWFGGESPQPEEVREDGGRTSPEEKPQPPASPLLQRPSPPMAISAPTQPCALPVRGPGAGLVPAHLASGVKTRQARPAVRSLSTPNLRRPTAPPSASVAPPSPAPKRPPSTAPPPPPPSLLEDRRHRPLPTRPDPAPPSPRTQAPLRPAFTSPGRPASVFSSSSSASASPSSPSTDAGPPSRRSPYLLLRSGNHDEPLVLVHPDQPHEHQPLTEVHLSGCPGEAVVATIPVQAEAAAPSSANEGSQPLVVRASVRFNSGDGGGLLDVTPPYLYLGAAAAGGARPQLRLRLLADRPGRYNGSLVLEYSGRRAEVAVRGRISHGDEGHWVTTEQAPVGEQVQGPPAAAPPAVSFGRVCVGCAVSRELRLRNCMAADCFVRTYVEGGGFEAEGGGQVAPNGLIKLTVTFRPSRAAAAVLGLLRVVVWEGDGEERGQDGQLRSSDGALLCSIDAGRRVYSVRLQASSYSPHRSSSSSSASASAPAMDDTTSLDSLSLSGDSVLGVSMGRSSGSSSDHHLRPDPHRRRRPQPPPPPSPACGVGLRPSGVFFGLEGLDFGARAVGGVCTLKIPLCNPLASPQLVVIQPLGLPFLVHHRCIRLRARAFVRLPVRFVPVTSGSFRATLRAEVHTIAHRPAAEQQADDTAGGPLSTCASSGGPAYHCKVLLLQLDGRAYHGDEP